MTDGPQYPRYPGEPDPGEQPTPQQSPGQQTPPPGYNPPPGEASAPAYEGPISNHPMQSGPPNPGAYASWGSRLGAYLIDGLLTTLIIAVPVAAGLIWAFVDSDVDPVTDELTGVNGLGILVAVLGFLAGFAFDIWNKIFRQGRRTQSIGKKLLGIKVVSLNHGGPIGAASALGRWAMQVIVPGAIPFAGFVYVLVDGLFPLWDDKSQSVHDKVISSVVVRA
ncbi:RDD family protein [Aeromicrobium sp. CF3.5]|uniref:RDD family protein n=1 Tax=Aeromicrobium sp. CF3.5 TaxID=3373078 RepID=UPI003EE6FE03